MEQEKNEIPRYYGEEALEAQTRVEEPREGEERPAHDTGGTTAEESRPRGPHKIDFTYLATRLWLKKYVLLAFLAVGIIMAVVIIKGTPREYGASISMMPEETGGNNASQIAIMMGFAAAGNGEDAYTPLVYPDIVASIPFVTALFDVEIQTSKSDSTYTVRDYVAGKLQYPWWSKVLPSLMPSDDEGEIADGDATQAVQSAPGEEVLDPFHLTKEEMNIVNLIRSRIWASMDKKTGQITIGADLQDPVAAAQLCDTVAARLQEYITDYRTAKARHDLEYAISMNEEAKQQYYDAQADYAEYMDRNQGLALYSAQTSRDRLENDMKLAFNLYNQTSQKVQQAEAKVQDVTPVFAVINPATVPLKPARPAKLKVIAVSVLLWLFIGCCVILYPTLFGNRFSSIMRQERRWRGLRGDSRPWYTRLIDRLRRRNGDDTEESGETYTENDIPVAEEMVIITSGDEVPDSSSDKGEPEDTVTEEEDDSRFYVLGRKRRKGVRDGKK